MGATQNLVGYIRVSSVAGRVDDRFHSPEDQRRALETWAATTYGSEHRWVGWFEDIDRTGTTLNRAGLTQAKETALSQRAAIVVFDLSRLARVVPETLVLVRELETAGVQVLSTSEAWDTATAEGEFAMTLTLAVNQLQVRKISDSWKRTVQRTRTAGRWHGVPPYGYERRPGGKPGEIVPHPKNAKRVKSVFRRYLAGESLYDISKADVRRGWYRRHGQTKDILQNRAYTGQVIVGAEYEPLLLKTGPDAGEPRTDKKGRPLKRRVPGTEQWAEGQHTALVSVEEFETAQKRLEAEKKEKAPIHTAARWSADRLIRCEACGRSMQYHEKGEPYRYVYCHNRDRCTARARAKVDDLEEFVSQVIPTLSDRLKLAVAEHVERIRQETGAGIDDTPETVTAEIAKLSKAITQAAKAILTAQAEGDEQTAEEFRQARDELRKEKETAEKKLHAIQAAQPQETETVIQTADTLAEAWPILSLDGKRDALKALGVAIYVGTPKDPDDPTSGFRVAVPWGNV